MDDRRGPRAYQELMQEAEGAVIRWAWGTLFLHDPRPYYAQRWGFSIPRPLKKPPAKKKQAREYGFDRDGRFRVVRTPTEFEGKLGEEFFWFGDGWTMSQRYDHFDMNNGLRSEFVSEDGRIIEAIQQTPRGSSEERYQYENDHLVSVAFQGADGSKALSNSGITTIACSLQSAKQAAQSSKLRRHAQKTDRQRTATRLDALNSSSETGRRRHGAYFRC